MDPRSESPVVRRRFVIRGRVQGVAFRAWTQAKATSLGLAGYVRNLPDGSVLAVAEGSPEIVASFAEACRRGPMLARVTAIEASDEAVEGTKGFDIRR